MKIKYFIMYCIYILRSLNAILNATIIIRNIHKQLISLISGRKLLSAKYETKFLEIFALKKICCDHFASETSPS